MTEISPFTLLLIELPFIILIIAAMWKIFTKAGEPGWACIIPFYNMYILAKIAGKSGWWVLLLCIPFINLIFCIWLTNLVSKSFGKDVGFTIGLVLLGIIFWPILAFGNSKYLGPYGNPAAFQEAQNPTFDFEQTNPLS